MWDRSPLDQSSFGGCGCLVRHVLDLLHGLHAAGVLVALLGLRGGGTRGLQGAEAGGGSVGLPALHGGGRQAQHLDRKDRLLRCDLYTFLPFEEHCGRGKGQVSGPS